MALRPKLRKARKTSYFADDQWNAMRDNLARTILLKQAAKLIDGDQLSEIARDMADMQMSEELRIMPESCRDDRGAEAMRLHELAERFPNATLADLGITLPEPVRNVITINTNAA